MKMTVIAGLVAVSAACAVRADVTVVKIYSDNMVLQRGKAVPVWGWGDSPGEKVKVSYRGVSATGVVDAKGCWEVRLPAMNVVKEGSELEISARNRVSFANVVVGDVYLVSGQSNAEFQTCRAAAYEDTQARAGLFPNIRSVKFAHETSPFPNVGNPNCFGWVVDDAVHVRGVTAVGYFMARELNEATGVPVGILDVNWGGCSIEPFICEESVRASSRFRGEMAKVESARRALAEWSRAAVLGERTGIFRISGEFPEGGLWTAQHNAMVEPIVRFPIAAAVWYQGCSNRGDGLGYAEKLELLVQGWRSKWGYTMPFYVVQLANLGTHSADPAGGDGFSPVREGQRRGVKRIPQTGLVVTIDIGDGNNVHPRNKQDVGSRLARWALRDVYGRRDVVVSGPHFRSLRREGDSLRLSFDSTGGGLMAAERDPDLPGAVPKAVSTLRGFAVAGADHRWHWAEARIVGEEVLVRAPGVGDPVEVRYAYSGNPGSDANLYNREGLPGVPFRSDD